MDTRHSYTPMPSSLGLGAVGRERALSAPSAPPEDPQGAPQGYYGGDPSQLYYQQQQLQQAPPAYGGLYPTIAPAVRAPQPQAPPAYNAPPPYQQQPAPGVGMSPSGGSQGQLPVLQGGFGPVHAMVPTPSMNRIPIPMTTDANSGMPVTPSSVVELRFRCKGLKKSDFISESDPFIVLYMQEQTRAWREIGRTETIENTPDPSFTRAFQVDFFFEEVQRLRVEVFDRDSSSEQLSAHDFLGCVELTMGQLMSSAGQSMVLALLQKSNGGRVRGLSGHVIISAEEVSTCADWINVRFAGAKLDNKDGWFGASDPFLNIYRLRDASCDPMAANSWVSVWKSEVIMNNLNPRWQLATVSVQTLCNGDLSRMLKLECMDWESSGRHQLIGSCTTTAGELISGEKPSMELINRERQLKKGKRYKNSGVLKVEHMEMFKKHTFAEYLRGGCEISLMAGIDFTASNGAVSRPDSLHYIGNGYAQNDYQAAISATGAILEPYDADKRFPLYGFGGLVNGLVNHCFPLTFDPTQPEVQGVNGMLEAYATSLQLVQLHGPTFFAPLINQAINIVQHFTGPQAPVPGQPPSSLKYYVLLIITDGAIMDMQPTIDAIVQASYLPMSIVIVGVGNADFSAMNALDGDGKILLDSRRQRAARDMYVPAV